MELSAGEPDHTAAAAGRPCNATRALKREKSADWKKRSGFLDHRRPPGLRAHDREWGTGRHRACACVRAEEKGSIRLSGHADMSQSIIAQLCETPIFEEAGAHLYLTVTLTLTLIDRGQG